MAGHFAQKPTRRRQGILEAATEHLRRYGEPVSPTGMLYQAFWAGVERSLIAVQYRTTTVSAFPWAMRTLAEIGKLPDSTATIKRLWRSSAERRLRFIHRRVDEDCL